MWMRAEAPPPMVSSDDPVRDWTQSLVLLLSSPSAFTEVNRTEFICRRTEAFILQRTRVPIGPNGSGERSHLQNQVDHQRKQSWTGSDLDQTGPKLQELFSDLQVNLEELLSGPVLPAGSAEPSGLRVKITEIAACTRSISSNTVSRNFRS